MASSFPGDLLELATDVLKSAEKHGVRIASAESCTGGLLAGLLTEIPGSSAVFERGFVTYSNEAKTEMLNVSEDLIAEHGAVSEPVARAMATGALANSHADMSVSITGIAGPGGSDFKPEGLVCFALGYGGGVLSEAVEFGSLGRSGVRLSAVRHALKLLGSRIPVLET